MNEDIRNAYPSPLLSSTIGSRDSNVSYEHGSVHDWSVVCARISGGFEEVHGNFGCLNESM